MTIIDINAAGREALDKMCNLSEGIYEDGINHGITKGKIETAIEMMKDGVPFDKIAKYTKLSLKVIEDVAKKNKLI